MVNFTNILCAIFVPNCSKYYPWLLQKSCLIDFRQKKLLKKCWWNWHLWSISPTFYESTCAKKRSYLKCKYKKASHKTKQKKPDVKCWWNRHVESSHNVTLLYVRSRNFSSMFNKWALSLFSFRSVWYCLVSLHLDRFVAIELTSNVLSPFFKDHDSTPWPESLEKLKKYCQHHLWLLKFKFVLT